MKPTPRNSFWIVLLALALLAPPAWAQDDEKELGWFFSGELSSVTTAGNAETRTVGFGSTLRRVWPITELRVDGGYIFSEASVIERTATGTSQMDFQVSETKITETTAKNYYARGRFDYNVSKRFFAFAGADWMRNTFAGIDSRSLFAIGAGNNWADSDKVRFKTDYGASYTFEQEVVTNPFVNQNFPGIRLAYDLWTQLTGSTQFTSLLITDWNLDNTDDIRVDFTNALPISISSKFSLKPQLRLMWRNDPALTEVPLMAADGTPTGSDVFVPLEKLDSYLTVALVFNL